jgi:hypothetical protein
MTLSVSFSSLARACPPPAATAQSSPYNSTVSPPIPIHTSAKATTVSSANDNEMDLQQLAKVLTSLRLQRDGGGDNYPY